MPYIQRERREQLLNGYPMEQPGDLAYLAWRLMHQYLECNGRRYGTFAEVVGVLETLKLELQRRDIAFYEDNKMIENGDVHG